MLVLFFKNISLLWSWVF